jgi:hypothetical protein
VIESRFQHRGACRCGALRISYHCDQPPEKLIPRACQCEFCRPKSASYVSAPQGRLEVRLRDRRMLYAHVFGTGTAEFMHCAFCNEMVFVRSEVDGRVYALVVAQALLEMPPGASGRSVDYASESLAERLSRRAANWIPELELIEDA